MWIWRWEQLYSKELYVLRLELQDIRKKKISMYDHCWYTGLVPCSVDHDRRTAERGFGVRPDIPRNFSDHNIRDQGHPALRSGTISKAEIVCLLCGTIVACASARSRYFKITASHELTDLTSQGKLQHRGSIFDRNMLNNNAINRKAAL